MKRDHDKTKEQLVSELAGLRQRVAELEAPETERKQVEKALRESEERYSAILNLGAEIGEAFIMRQDTDQGEGIMSFVSDEWPRITGYSKEKLLGMSFFDLVRPKDREASRGRYRKRMGGESLSGLFELCIIRKDGTEVPIELTSAHTTYRGERANVAYIRNITKRKQAEEKIQQQNEFLNTVLESLTHPFYVIDANDYTVKLANSAASVGRSSENITCYALTHKSSEPCGSAEHSCPLEEVKKTRKQVFVEHIHYDKDGNFRNVEVHGFPIFDTEGNVIQMIEYCLDITERKQAEEKLISLYEEIKTLNLELEERVKERTRRLEQALQASEVASQAKSNFLGSMSHELRTPLNAVIGFSQILRKQYFGKLNEKQAEYVTDILKSGQHLLSLINDILDLAQIEAGKTELELSKVKIKGLLERSLAMIKEKALVHGISLDIDTAGDLEGLEIMVDERRLKQAMFNLLSNAAKFTPDGGTIRVEGKKEGKELIISVSDTGIGIAPEEQERIFGEFYQTSGGTKDKTPGTGLGLPVTKNIVEMHGGRIWVESEGQYKGSRFTFTLPIG